MCRKTIGLVLFLGTMGSLLGQINPETLPKDSTEIDSFKAGKTPLFQGKETTEETVPEMMPQPLMSAPPMSKDGKEERPVLDTIKVDSLKSDIQLGNNAYADWKSGKSKYPPKPKHMWELGVGLGHYFISGDVDSRFPGYGFALHVRRALHYAFSIRMEAYYGVAYGLEPQPYMSALDNELEVFKGYGTAENNPWFPAYRTKYYYGAVEGILNIGNILFHKDHNKWNWYLFLGIGLDHNETALDLRDENGNVYSQLIQRSGFTVQKFDTKSGRSEIKDNLKSIYDGSYETPAYKQKGIFRLGDKNNIHVMFNGGVGLARKINRRLNIALEHQIMITDNDYLDGIKWRTNLDQTTQNDVQHYTNLRLAINLGSFKNRKEPLYWLNPLDGVFSDIADLKQRPVFDLKDSDQDGVIDLLDQENDTPPGAPVDTRGIALDSDNDGIVDYKDEEPYSPAGFGVNEKGVAQVPQQPKVTEDDVRKLIDQRLGIPPGTKDGDAAAKALLANMDWFLPMIHFNLDEYCVPEKYAGQLANVAHVMRIHEKMKITVQGHTDIQYTNAYNKVLSYYRAKEAIDYMVSRYQIPRERFILMYGGEDHPLGGHMNNHMINRRVEFRVSNPEDQEMPKPEGPKAGACHKKWMRKSAPVKTEDASGKDKK